MIIVRICTEYLQMIYQNQFVSNLVSTRGLKSEKEHLTVTLIQQLLIFPNFKPTMQNQWVSTVGVKVGTSSNLFVIYSN